MYYPKSQIQTNLFSNGFLVNKSTGEIYYGAYYKLFNGKLFTGKTPQDGPNEELINISERVSLINNNKNPIYFQNVPNSNDYDFGSFIRYFCKKINELIYIEISKETYENINNQSPKIYWSLYSPFYINWILTGEKNQVYKTNKNIIDLIIKEKKLYQFNNYLKEDYTKFWRIK